MQYDQRPGTPYDRGMADSYYRRPYRPHYFIFKTGVEREEVTQDKMTPNEIKAYKAGYEDFEYYGDKKEYR